jgi:hypothetical protein
MPASAVSSEARSSFLPDRRDRRLAGDCGGHIDQRAGIGGHEPLHATSEQRPGGEVVARQRRAGIGRPACRLCGRVGQRPGLAAGLPHVAGGVADRGVVIDGRRPAFRRQREHGAGGGDRLVGGRGGGADLAGSFCGVAGGVAGAALCRSGGLAGGIRVAGRGARGGLGIGGLLSGCCRLRGSGAGVGEEIADLLAASADREVAAVAGQAAVGVEDREATRLAAIADGHEQRGRWRQALRQVIHHAALHARRGRHEPTRGQVKRAEGAVQHLAGRLIGGGHVLLRA